jgi:hypothetical protein
MPRTFSYRLSLYVLVNVAFALLVGVAYAVGGFPNARLVHLILLFALCSSCMIDFDGLNGRYGLLGLFMIVYFVSYGVGDLSDLITARDASNLTSQPVSGALSKPEVVILVGGMMLVLGYRTAVMLVNASLPTRSPRDWSRSAILVIGVLFWTIGTIATYRWNLYIVSDSTNEAYRKGLAGISSFTTTAYLLGQMCQPLGILLLAYAYRVFRSPYLLAVVIVIVVSQLFIGFVVDIKGLAMLGMILVIMTSVLVDGRVPKIWLVGFAIFVIFLFPFFQAYRTAIHGNSGLTRTAVVENFGKVLELTIAARDKVNSGRNRAQTFLERSSVKGSTEIIVEKTGSDVDFQRGHTLSPMLATFIPKILWADKLRIPTGQLVNQKFHMTDSDDIYISPSHLGELYWNFGWSGVLIGMTAIGLICGWIGARFNLAEFRTVTRVLVTVITIKQLIVGFEGSISDIYVVWLRAIAGIGILHLIFARVPAVSRSFRPTSSGLEVATAERPDARRLFPNLLT